MKRTLSLTLMLFCCCVLNAGDEFCGIRNTAFQTGENTTYTIYYTLGVYIAAGEANFNVALEQFNNKSVYHITGTGKTYPFYSFFKVRDKYENVTFDRETNTAVTNNGVFKTTDCIQDVLSAIFYARNINFSKYKVDDKIPFTMFLDNEKYDLYIRYMGKETIKTKYGRFKAIKFKPLLVKGTIFTGGEKMVVWVSDDANHLPLRVESPISVGSIKADMMNYKNLRYPLSSLISVR